MTTGRRVPPSKSAPAVLPMLRLQATERDAQREGLCAGSGWCPEPEAAAPGRQGLGSETSTISPVIPT